MIDMSYDYGESEDSWFNLKLWAEQKKEPEVSHAGAST